MTEKKFGGIIENWYKQEVTGGLGYVVTQQDLNKAYGKNLGYVIRGYLLEDPTGRGFGYGPIRTSLAVKLNKEKTELETLNTIYHLGKAFNRTPKLDERVWKNL